MNQQFEMVKSSISVRSDSGIKRDFNYVKSLADEINERVYPNGETFLEPFAVDENNTPKFDELFPFEIKEED